MSVIILWAVLLPLPVGPMPTLADMERFPPRGIVISNLAFAQEHDRRLREHCVSEELWVQSQFCYRAWDLLDNASRDSPNIEYRLDQLLSLRAHVGVNAYRGGRMPPPVPWWLFADLTGTQFNQSLGESP